MEPSVSGRIFLCYGGVSSPPSLTRNFHGALCYQPSRHKVLITRPGSTDLCLPLRPTCYTSYAVRDGCWSLQVRGLPPPHACITLKLSGAPARALSLFVACLTGSRLARREEVQAALRGDASSTSNAPFATAEASATAAAPRAIGNADEDLLRGWTRPASSGARAAPPRSSASAASVSAAREVQLTPEQSAVLSAVTSGVKGVFFTGSAGTGKSHVLQRLRDALDPAVTAFTASTGIAAVALQGTTIHSWAGLAPAMLEVIEGPRCTAEALSGVVREVLKRREAVARWRRTRTLLVDEISMLSGPLLDALEAVARAVRGSDAPFGGLQLVFAGDFFQLPPVFRGTSSSSSSSSAGAAEGGAGRFAFQAHCWESIVTTSIVLTRVFRQGEDGAFIALLNEARVGKISAESAALLGARFGARLALPMGVEPTRLVTHRADIGAENAACLERLPGERRVFEAADHVPGSKQQAGEGGGGGQGAALLSAACPAPPSLALKVGAQVMLTKTLDAGAGLVNGARGVVIGFQGQGGASGGGAGGGGALQAGGGGGGGGYPMVRFLGCSGKAVECAVKPAVWEVKVGGGSTASRTALPLQLAWVLSIHKSQGMTLDACELALGKVFEFGQAYVALSRARSLHTITLSDKFNPACIRAHPDVVAFYVSRAQAVGVGGGGSVKPAVAGVGRSSAPPAAPRPPAPAFHPTKALASPLKKAPHTTAPHAAAPPPPPCAAPPIAAAASPPTPPPATAPAGASASAAAAAAVAIAVPGSPASARGASPLRSLKSPAAASPPSAQARPPFLVGSSGNSSSYRRGREAAFSARKVSLATLASPSQRSPPTKSFKVAHASVSPSKASGGSPLREGI